MTNEAKRNKDTVDPLVVWILICRSWNGNTYDTEICGGYDDENKARERAKIYQGNQKPADIEYLVEQHIIDRTHNRGSSVSGPASGTE